MQFTDTSNHNTRQTDRYLSAILHLNSIFSDLPRSEFNAPNIRVLKMAYLQPQADQPSDAHVIIADTRKLAGRIPLLQLMWNVVLDFSDAPEILVNKKLSHGFAEPTQAATGPGSGVSVPPYPNSTLRQVQTTPWRLPAGRHRPHIRSTPMH